MFKSVNEFCDIVSVLVCCSDDKTYLFLPSEDGSNDFTIPSGKIRSDGWNMGLRKTLKEKFNFDSNNTETILKIHRIWNPINLTLLNHVVFKISVSIDKKRNIKPTSKVKGKIRWMTESDVVFFANAGNLKSPELADFVSAAKGTLIRSPPTSNQSWPIITNYRPLGKLNEISEDHFIVMTEQVGGTPLSAQQQLIKAAGFEENEQCLILQHFLLLCYPYMYMSRLTFITLIVKIGWAKDQVSDLFRAADVFGQNALSFRDYLFVMAAIEPSTLHGGLPAEVRCQYMFRFLDKNNNGKIDYNELKVLVQMSRKSRNMPTDQASVSKEYDETAKNINLEKSGRISVHQFVQAIIDQKIKGTSVVLRSPKSLLIHIKELRDAFPSMRLSEGQIKRSQDTETRIAPMAGLTPGYEIAIHSIKLKRTGGILCIDQLWQVDSAAGEPQTKMVVGTKDSTPVSEKVQFSRLMSVDSFKTKSAHGELLTGLHYFCSSMSPAEAAKKGGKSKDAFSWGQINHTAFGNILMQVCKKAAEICRSEPRLLELQSPVYVLGDLHGNLLDLTIFEKVLWSLGPNLTPCTILFLGDYVDRGPHGVEVVGFLFAYKVQNPLKVKLIRGNHEIRDIQKMFTFFNECISKFGDSLGTQIWNCINEVFDNLPLAATIDGKVFCCHGGIPPPWLCPVVSAIKSIPCPLTNPDQQSVLAWELMWNDPIRTGKMSESVMQELKTKEGFATNTRRGTAHVFSDDALQRFLTVNGFSHIIRAHEVQQAGFLVQQKGKLVTVFSSSRYCGGTNEAACVLAYLGKLRVFRINTSL